MLVREVRELAGSNDDAEILFAEDAPLHVLEQWIIESTEVNGHLTITLDMSVLSSDSIVEKAREDGSGDDNPMLPDRVATHSNYPHGGEWLDEVIESNLSLNVAGEYSLPKYDDELEIEAWRFQMSRWRSECADRRRRGMWGQEEWGPSRRLRLSEVSEIRGAMPFGPLSLDECETFAIRFESHPRTILRIAKGRIYAKPAACPPDHPFRWSLAEYGVPKRWSLAEIMGVGVPKKEADDKRRAAQKYRNEIGEAQDWKCKYCGADVSGKGKSALDHIMPIMFGGTSERSNLQILCRRCNGEKSATQPSAELDVRMTRMVDGESMVKTMMQEMSGTSSCNEMAMILSLHGADLRNLLGPSSYRKIFEALRRRARMMPDYRDSIWYDDAPVVHCILLMEHVELCVARGAERRGRQNTSVIEDVSCYLCRAAVKELRENTDIHYFRSFGRNASCMDVRESSYGLATRDRKSVSCESCLDVLESSLSPTSFLRSVSR